MYMHVGCVRVYRNFARGHVGEEKMGKRFDMLLRDSPFTSRFVERCSIEKYDI